MDFSQSVLAGHVVLSLEKVEPDVSLLLLDVSRLTVTAVQVRQGEQLLRSLSCS